MSTPSKAATHTAPDARRTTADALIAAADLPTPVAERVAAIVRATRLWKSERADIARELIAHAQDALTAGRTPEDTADALGDPATIAPLLRRSAKRKRPWHWHVRRRTLQAVGISLLAMIGVYTVLFIRFNTGSPDIKHNYLAELNARNNAYPDDQKALPAFEALHRAWSPLYHQLYLTDAEYRRAESIENPDNITAFEQFPYSPPDAPLYDRLLTAYVSVRPQLDSAISASRRPVLGMVYSDRQEKFLDEQGTQFFRVLPPTDDPRLAGPVIEVLLPALGQARSIARLIAFDALLAAREGDPERASLSLTAIFDTARQLAQEHTLIASLVAIAVQTDGENMLLYVLSNYPDLLSETHLTAIAHTAAISGRTARDLDFATERRMFADFLQRAYTDDGHGDGRLTAEGVRLARLVEAITIDGADLENSLLTPVTGPLAMVAFGSRRDQDEINARLIDLAEALLAAPPGSAENLRLQEEITRQEESLGSDRRYAMAAALTPALTRAVENAHRAKARTDATLTTIALHIHHRRTGRWPDSLAELTPHLLPTVPEDPFDPGQPIKFLLIDNTPHIYFIGADGEDNAASDPVAPANEQAVSSLSQRYRPGHSHPATDPEHRGDWIIFPPTPD